MNKHESYIRRCLWLAHKGSGLVAPNPMVGAVVVHHNGIIGEGYHHQYGGPHAEVYAIEMAAKHLSDLSACALYVNLEPCSHHGKTPPCADLILKSGIGEVVIAQTDPNPLVAGGGIQRLREAGVKVTAGVLEKEARHLNRRFNTFFEIARPYVVLKWAQTSDGYLDVMRKPNDLKGIRWISAPGVKKRVHAWRAEESAILVGAGTIRTDNPSLTVREVLGKSPIRIVLSRTGHLPAGAAVLSDGLPTLVFNNQKTATDGPVEWINIPDGMPTLPYLMNELMSRGIQSVMVEGGAHTLQSFVESELWDEARIITSTASLAQVAPGYTTHEGLKAPQLQSARSEREIYAGDTITTYYRKP